MSLSKVFAIYSTSQKAEAAVDGLLSSGFKASAISVLHSDNRSTRESRFADCSNGRFRGAEDLRP